jgi:hypothetical protein
MREGIMIPKLGSITLPKQNKRIYVLEWLSVRDRSLRHGQCQMEVSSDYKIVAVVLDV